MYDREEMHLSGLLTSLLVALVLGCQDAGTPLRESLEESRPDREVVRQVYGPFFDQLSSILFRLDPMGISYEHNPDEYEPEAGTIIPRLEACRLHPRRPAPPGRVGRMRSG